MEDIPSLRLPIHIPDEKVCEVMIGGRWIRILQGSYRETSYDERVSFVSDEGKVYATTPRHIQLKVAYATR